MEDVKVLKVKISELFLSNKMQNVMLKNPFLQLEYNDIEKRTQTGISKLVEQRYISFPKLYQQVCCSPGQSVIKSKNNIPLQEVFQFQVKSAKEDDILIQFRDDENGKANVLGQTVLKVKDLIKQVGRENWYKLMSQSIDNSPSKEVIQIQMSIQVTGDTRQSKQKKTQIQKIDKSQFNQNVVKQEQYMLEQRQKMQEAKNEIKKMTQEMDALNMFTPFKQTIQAANEQPRVGTSKWPLNRTYITKVTKNQPIFTKPSSNSKMSESPISKISRKSQKSTNQVSNGSRNTKDLSHYTQKPDYILDDSVMFKTTSAMQNKDKTQTPIKKDAFNRNRHEYDDDGDSNTYTPQKNIKYALGSNKDQVNLVL